MLRPTTGQSLFGHAYSTSAKALIHVVAYGNTVRPPTVPAALISRNVVNLIIKQKRVSVVGFVRRLRVKNPDPERAVLNSISLGNVFR